MKLPAFQFYPGDWRKDSGVQSLSFHDRGVWFEILCLMHESESRGRLTLNGNAMPDDALARILGLDKQILTTTLTTLLTYGVASKCEETGALICRRMVRDEELREIRRSAGKLGGNPALLKQKPTTPVKQKSTPSSSSSSSSSVSDSKNTPLTPQGGKRFKKPSLDELNEYGKTLTPPWKDGQRFLDFYESKGWKVGNQSMKDWKAAVRTWNSKAKESAHAHTTTQRAY
jgi:hypothetical protein